MVVLEQTGEAPVAEDECPIVGKRENAHGRAIVAAFPFQSSAGDIGLVTVAHDSLKIWRIDEGESDVVAFTERCEVKKWRCGVQSTDATPDGKCIVVLGIDSIIYEVTISENGPELRPIDLGYMEAWHIKISKNHRSYITTSFSNHVTELDLDCNISKREPFPNVKHVSSIAFNHSNSVLAVANTEGLVVLLDTDTLKQIGSFEIHAMKIRVMMFTANDEKLLTGSDDRTLKLYKVAGEGIGPDKQFCGHRSPVLSAAFDETSGGTRFASSSHSGEILLWNVEQTAPTHVLKSLHQGQIQSVAFSPSGRHLFVGGDDKKISCHKVPQLFIHDGEPSALMEFDETATGDAHNDDVDVV